MSGQTGPTAAWSNTARRAGVAARYEKLAVTYLAMVTIAAILI